MIRNGSYIGTVAHRQWSGIGQKYGGLGGFQDCQHCSVTQHRNLHQHSQTIHLKKHCLQPSGKYFNWYGKTRSRSTYLSEFVEGIRYVLLDKIVGSPDSR